MKTTAHPSVEQFYHRIDQDALSPSTERNYHYVMDSFVVFLKQDPAGATTEDIRDYLSALRKRGLAPATIATHHRILRLFFNFLKEEGMLDTSPVSNLKPPRMPRQYPRIVSDEDMAKLLRAAHRSSQRDYAVILVFLDCGLRLGELCGLDIDDLDITTQSLRVRNGKGSRERQVFFGQTTGKALKKWLRHRGVEAFEEALFINKHRERLAPRGVQRMLRRLGVRSDVKVTPHRLRHTFATNYCRNGGDPFSLQRLLGHQDIRTCAIYVEMSGAALRDAHRRASPADNLST